jgi:hypothetical protein
MTLSLKMICLYAECPVLLIIMVNVVMLSVVAPVAALVGLLVVDHFS